MVDKSISFAFNTVNDPTPADTVMEDGSTTSASSKQPDEQQKILNTMKDGFDMISQLLLLDGTRKEEETDEIEQMYKALGLVEQLERQIKSQRSLANKRKGKASICRRIQILEAALVKAYTAIGDGGVLRGGHERR